MNHDEMIANAVQAAKNAMPLTVGDGMVIADMIKRLATTLAEVAVYDEQVNEMLDIVENARAMTDRLNQR